MLPLVGRGAVDTKSRRIFPDIAFQPEPKTAREATFVFIHFCIRGYNRPTIIRNSTGDGSRQCRQTCHWNQPPLVQDYFRTQINLSLWDGVPYSGTHEQGNARILQQQASFVEEFSRISDCQQSTSFSGDCHVQGNITHRGNNSLRLSAR